MHPSSIECALDVFRELGLIDVHTESLDFNAPRMVMVKTNHERVDLVDSVRYREGLNGRALFDSYKQQALFESASTLRDKIARPIVPPCAAACDNA